MALAPIHAAAGPVIPDFGGGNATPSCARENRLFCWDWFSANWASTFRPALIEHVYLTLIAVAIGFAIAFAAAIVAYRRGWFERPFTVLSGVLYTIPSLALFQLLVPITGLGTLTAEIALVSYTLLIIFRNVLTGLREVPRDVLDAARGMGYGPNQMLLRIELPLAMPAIVAGLRIAVVTIISLATVAAYITDQGLGAPIFAALQNGFKTEILGAGLLAVALAFVADGLLVLTQRLLTPWARARQA